MNKVRFSTNQKHTMKNTTTNTNAGPATQGQMMFKVTLAKKTAAGWDMDYASGQLEHMASYHATKADADAEADRRNSKLAQEMADGLGLDVEEYEESGRAADSAQYYHVVTA